MKKMIFLSLTLASSIMASPSDLVGMGLVDTESPFVDTPPSLPNEISKEQLAQHVKELSKSPAVRYTLITGGAVAVIAGSAYVGFHIGVSRIIYEMMRRM